VGSARGDGDGRPQRQTAKVWGNGRPGGGRGDGEFSRRGRANSALPYVKRPRQLRKCERGLLDPFSGNPRSCPQGHVPRVEDAPSGNREYDTFFGGGVDTMSTLRSFTEGVGLGIAGTLTATAGGG
jgi:hypothetical protein